MIVIAQFSKWKTLSIVVFSYAVYALLCFATLYHASGGLYEHIASRGQFWVPLVLVALLCGFLLLLLMTVVLAQLLFHNCNAIWIEGDKIIYLNRFFIAVKRSAIMNISVGSFGYSKHPAIIIELRNGTKKTIPVGILTEPVQVVLARLKGWRSDVGADGLRASR